MIGSAIGDESTNESVEEAPGAVDALGLFVLRFGEDKHLLHISHLVLISKIK